MREVLLADGNRFAVSGEGFIPEGEVTAAGTPVVPGSQSQLERLALAAVLCNEGDLHRRDGEWIWRGDAVDLALLSLAHKLGITREQSLIDLPEVNLIPFEPERQFAASYHHSKGKTLELVKGAPERVLAMCDWGENRCGHEEALQEARTMAEQGYRILALAERSLPVEVDPQQLAPEPKELTFLGMVGMIDPLRPGAKEAVVECHRAGVGAVMITGDHPVTALAIANELGLAKDATQVISGSELVNMSEDELDQAVQSNRVFARVAPHHKLQLVEAAQRVGHFVAVTGDGVNDAPAIRKANIGVAMGKSGTDVAREAAELVISDDSFATIVAGVEEGRIAYDNVRKVIYLLISTGASEVVLVGLALFAGLPLPLLAVQLLWLNLVTNGIQDVALAFEPGEGGILKRKPRPPREGVFNQLMIQRVAVASLVIGSVAFGTFWWLLNSGWSVESARNAILLLMVLFENVHIGNCRSEIKSALVLSPFRNPILLAGAALALMLHLGAMFTPLGQLVLHVEPVSLKTMVTLWGLSLSVFVAIEIHKWMLTTSQMSGKR